MSDELVEAVLAAINAVEYAGANVIIDAQLAPGEVDALARAAIAVVIERVVRELDKCGEPCPVCHDAIRKLGESE